MTDCGYLSIPEAQMACDWEKWNSGLWDLGDFERRGPRTVCILSSRGLRGVWGPCRTLAIGDSGDSESSKRFWTSRTQRLIDV